MEAKKFHDLLPASWRTMKDDEIIQSESEGPRIRGLMLLRPDPNQEIQSPKAGDGGCLGFRREKAKVPFLQFFALDKAVLLTALWVMQAPALLILLIQMLISEEDVLLDLNPGILALRLELLSTTLSPTVDRDASTNLKALI